MAIATSPTAAWPLGADLLVRCLVGYSRLARKLAGRLIGSVSCPGMWGAGGCHTPVRTVTGG